MRTSMTSWSRTPSPISVVWAARFAIRVQLRFIGALIWTPARCSTSRRAARRRCVFGAMSNTSHTRVIPTHWHHSRSFNIEANLIGLWIDTCTIDCWPYCFGKRNAHLWNCRFGLFIYLSAYYHAQYRSHLLNDRRTHTHTRFGLDLNISIWAAMMTTSPYYSQFIVI